MKQGVRYALAALAVVLLAGCSAHPAPPVRIGTNTWPGYEPLYLAQDLGRLGPKNVRLTRFHSATEVMGAFGAGTIDAAALTLDEALLLLASGREARIVLVMDTSQGGDAIVAHPGVRDLKDLAGRRVGVEQTAVGAYMASRAFQKAGLSPEQVSLVDLPANQHAAAFLGGQVDAVVTFEPMRSALVAAGGVELFSSAEIPGEIVDVLVVNPTFLDRHPERVRAVVAGWFEALDYLKSQPSKAANFMAMRLHLTPSAVMKACDGLRFPTPADNRRMLVGTGGVPQLATAASRLHETMRTMGLLPHAVMPARLFPGPDDVEPLLTRKGEPDRT
jgi:NitT/TauT family transport system substrate-binding protein